MGSLDGERLSQLYLELADASKERFMRQNGQVAVLKCSAIWKKIRKSFNTLYELKLKFIPKARDSNSTFIPFLFKPDNFVQLLKNMGGCVMGGCIPLRFYKNNKKEK